MLRFSIQFQSLIESLEKQPVQGVLLGNNCFKIRLPISSKGKGKSGGARIVTNFIISERTVNLIAIHDKS